MYAFCIGKNNQSSQDIHLFLTVCWFLHFSFVFFFSVLQSTIILSEFKHNVTLTGQNASLIHCARLIYLQPTPPLNNCAKPTHSLTKEGQLKIQNGFRPNIHLHKSKSLFSKYPLRKLNTCSSGYKTKRVELCSSCQFK